MKFTGNQLRAACAIANIPYKTLAHKAGCSEIWLKTMVRSNDEQVSGSYHICAAIRKVMLDDYNVAFTPYGVAKYVSCNPIASVVAAE